MIQKLLLSLTILQTILFAQDSTGFSDSSDNMLNLDITPKIRIETLFRDNEPDSILYSPQERGFHVNQMVRVIQVGSDQFIVSNFTPARFGVTLIQQVNGVDTITLEMLDSIPPFSRISGYFSQTVPQDSLSDSLLILTCEDSLFTKLQQITVPWFVSFSSHEGGRWGKVRPFDARRYCAGIANFGWLVSRDRFKKYLHNEKYQLLNNRTNKAGDSVNPVIDRDQFFHRLYNHRAFTLGKIVSEVGGLGVWTSADDSTFVGAYQEHSLMGVQFFSFYRTDKTFAIRIFAHETGHLMGFTHESTIAIDDSNDPNRTGFPSMVSDCYIELLKDQQLPFVKDPFLNSLAN